MVSKATGITGIPGWKRGLKGLLGEMPRTVQEKKSLHTQDDHAAAGQDLGVSRRVVETSKAWQHGLTKTGGLIVHDSVKLF